MMNGNFDPKHSRMNVRVPLALVLLAAILLTACLSACRQALQQTDPGTKTPEGEKEYSIRDIEIVDGLNAPTTRYQWMETPEYIKIDPDAVKERTIVFEGKEYLCKYSKSYMPSDRLTEYDAYSTNINDPGVPSGFGIDRQTGEIVCVGFGGVLSKTDETPENIFKTVSDKATEIAANYIDLAEYTMTYTDELTYVTDYSRKTGPYYIFRFARRIGEYETSDRLVIEFTSDGQLRAIKMRDLGAFKNISADSVPEFDEEKLDIAIKKHIVESSVLDREILSYDVEQRFVTRDKNGKFLVITVAYYTLSNNGDVILYDGFAAEI